MIHWLFLIKADLPVLPAGDPTSGQLSQPLGLVPLVSGPACLPLTVLETRHSNTVAQNNVNSSSQVYNGDEAM